MRQLVRFSLLFLAMALTLTAAPYSVSAATEKAETEKKSSSPPINISADQMEASDKERLILFTGNVVARQEDMILECDLMKVYYASEKAASQESGSEQNASTSTGSDAPVLGGRDSQIKRIEAEGNVKITRGDQVAEAQKAIYHAKTKPRTIILTGDPRVWRDKDFLTGSKITYYLDENRSLVEGGPKKRVNAIFYQESDEKKDSKE